MEQISSLVKERFDRVVFQGQILQSGFAAFPYLVMKDKHLTIGARLTYAFLLMYGWQENSCFAGQKRIGEDIGLSDRQVQRYLYELRDQGYIRIERRDKRYNNTYLILDRKKPFKLRSRKKA